MLETLILARHAHAASNAGDTINGIPPGEGLSPQGPRRPSRSARMLAAEPIELGVSSRFRRAAETAHARTRGRGRPRHRRAGARRDRLRLVRGRLARRVPRMGVGAAARGRVPGGRRDARRRRRALAGGLAALLHRPEARDPRGHSRPARALRDRCRGRPFPGAAARAVPHAVAVSGSSGLGRARRRDAGRVGGGAGFATARSPIPLLADDDPAAHGRCNWQRDRATSPSSRRGPRGPPRRRRGRLQWRRRWPYPSSRASRTSRRRAPRPIPPASRSKLDGPMPGTDKELAFSAEGGFDTPAKRSQMSVDLSSVAELMKSFGASLGGKVPAISEAPATGSSRRSRTATPRTSSSRSRQAATRRQDLDQGGREDALASQHRSAEAVRLIRRHRSA